MNPKTFTPENLHLLPRHKTPVVSIRNVKFLKVDSGATSANNNSTQNFLTTDKKNALLKLVFFWLLFLIPILCFSQNKQSIENQLQEAKLSIYQNPEKAIKLASEVFKKTEDTNIKITALVTLVNGYTAINQNEDALVYATKALNLAKSSGTKHHQIRILGLLGEQYQLYHLNEISREYLSRAEKLIDASKLPEEVVAVSKGNIFAVKGNGYKDEIDCAYAIENYDLAIKAYKQLPNQSSAENNLALVYLEKGDCLLELGKLAVAEKNFHKALAIAQKNDLKEYEQYAYLGLAKIDTKVCSYESAINHLQSLENDNKLTPKSKNDLYFLLKENYLALNAMENYFRYAKKYQRTSKEIKALENANFQQVLEFIQTKPIATPAKFNKEKILLYALFVLCSALILWEVFKGFNTTKKLKN